MIHLRSVSLPPTAIHPSDGFPFTLPIVRAFEPLEFTTHVTFFVGENGSGKSTVLEAIAVASGAITAGSDGVDTDRTLSGVRKLAKALDVEPERFISRDKHGLTLMTVAEAASRLGVPAGRVQTWLRKGQVSGNKVSGEWRVPSVVIAELARSGRLRGRSGRLDPRFRG